MDTLRHSLLLVGALLCTHPLGPDVSVEFGVDLEVIQDTGVVQGSNLQDSLAWESGSLTPHGGTAVAAGRCQY